MNIVAEIEIVYSVVNIRFYIILPIVVYSNRFSDIKEFNFSVSYGDIKK